MEQANMEAQQNAAEVLSQDGPEEVQEVHAPEDAEAPKGGEPEHAQETEQEPDEKPKRLGGWQRKILKLEQETEYWRQEALRNRTAEKPAQQPKGAPRPKMEQFQTWEEYEAAENKWLEDQIEAKVQAREANRRQEELAAKYEQEVETARAGIEDYDEVTANRPAYTPDMVTFMLKSGVGPYLDYYFSMNPQDAAKVRALRDRDEVMAAMGEYRAHVRAVLSESESGEEAEEAEPPKPKAPKPLTPVTKPSASSTAPTEHDDADTWMKKRWKQIKAQGRAI